MLSECPWITLTQSAWGNMPPDTCQSNVHGTVSVRNTFNLLNLPNSKVLMIYGVIHVTNLCPFSVLVWLCNWKLMEAEKGNFPSFRTVRNTCSAECGARLTSALFGDPLPHGAEASLRTIQRPPLRTVWRSPLRTMRRHPLRRVRRSPLRTVRRPPLRRVRRAHFGDGFRAYLKSGLGSTAEV